MLPASPSSVASAVKGTYALYPYFLETARFQAVSSWEGQNIISLKQHKI